MVWSKSEYFTLCSANLISENWKFLLYMYKTFYNIKEHFWDINNIKEHFCIFMAWKSNLPNRCDKLQWNKLNTFPVNTIMINIYTK